MLLWSEHGAVKGRQFNPGRCIGSMADRLRVLERRDIDELIILDISATPNNRAPRFEEVSALCDSLFMPVTIGGGVRSVADIRRLLAGGADKVAIGTMACDRPEIIGEGAKRFGSQAVVVSIDVLRGRVHTACGRHDSGRHPVAWAREVESRGAGEILLTSVDRDGMMGGYDLELIREVSDAVAIPVVAAGGCGDYAHMAAALSAGAHAVAVGAAFQFKELTPKGGARYLREQGFQVRI